MNTPATFTSQWIDVRERLPKVGDVVIVWSRGITGFAYMPRAAFFGQGTDAPNGRWYVGDSRELHLVTHWMQMPGSPSAEQEENRGMGGRQFPKLPPFEFEGAFGKPVVGYFGK